MGDCCSSDVNTVTDSSTMPEKMPVKGHDGDSDDDESMSTRNTSHRKGSKSTEMERLIKKQWQDAIEAGDNHKIKEIFRQNHKQINFLSITFENGDNSLHYAVRKGNTKLVKFLILLKVDINSKNLEDGNTALHLAVQLQNASLASLLMKNENIDKNCRNNKNETAKEIAINLGHNRMVSLLEKYERNEKEDETDNDTDNENETENENENGIIRNGTFGNGGDTHTQTNSEQLEMPPTATLQTSVSSMSDDDGNDFEEKPFMMGFLEKKQNKYPYKWQKQWCVVTRSYILLATEQVQIQDASSPVTRAQFDECIEMTSVVSVSPKKSKKEQNKFVLATSIDGKPIDPTKPPSDKNEIIFRCDSENIRNKWVHKLTKHCKKVFKLQYLKTFNQLPPN